MYKQYELQADESVLTCWLKVDPRLKTGIQITLKQLPDVIWTIRQVYSTELPTAPNQRWEGLDVQTSINYAAKT